MRNTKNPDWVKLANYEMTKKGSWLIYKALYNKHHHQYIIYNPDPVFDIKFGSYSEALKYAEDNEHLLLYNEMYIILNDRDIQYREL